VVKVADGDTLTVLVNKTQIRVRLDAIDAPERGQAFGKQSGQSLADMCAAKRATVIEYGKDRYGRTIGRVTCAGVDACLKKCLRHGARVRAALCPSRRIAGLVVQTPWSSKPTTCGIPWNSELRLPAWKDPRGSRELSGSSAFFIES
jgi:hypothetical protein